MPCTLFYDYSEWRYTPIVATARLHDFTAPAHFVLTLNAPSRCRYAVH